MSGVRTPTLANHPALRWLVPAFAALAVLGGGAAVGVLKAADPSLPPRTAAELLADLGTAKVDGLSGTLVYTANLGLPALPGAAGRGGAELSSLLAGTHTLRVWYSGPAQARLALLGTLGETDVITNGRDVWTWSSRENTATHYTLPSAAGPAGLPGLPSAGVSALPLTPRQLADAALAAIEPSTVVRTDPAVRVAGRDAYELVLEPREGTCLVAAVRISIDAVEHVPLRVQVMARGTGDPALLAAFTQVSFDRPGAKNFEFNPPPGAQVDERAGPSTATPPAVDPGDLTPGGAPALTTVGTGWTRVLVVRAPSGSPAPGAPSGDPPGGPGSGPGGDLGGLAAFLNGLPRVSGDWGSGIQLAGTLFSALLTDDGRLLVGAVTPQRLYQVAADPAARLAK